MISDGQFLQFKQIWSIGYSTPVTHAPGAKHIRRIIGCHVIKTLLQANMQKIAPTIRTQMLLVSQSCLEPTTYFTTIQKSSNF